MKTFGSTHKMQGVPINCPLKPIQWFYIQYFLNHSRGDFPTDEFILIQAVEATSQQWTNVSLEVLG
jgi:hypothetical protein